MFHPKHVELFAGNKILYKKSVILLEHLKKYMKYVHFPWPPLSAAMSIFNVIYVDKTHFVRRNK
jgi:hypothetical protein